MKHLDIGHFNMKYIWIGFRLAKACETKLVCLAKAGEFSLKSLLDCGPLYASAFTCENLIKLKSADFTC